MIHEKSRIVSTMRLSFALFKRAATATHNSPDSEENSLPDFKESARAIVFSAV